MPRPDSVRISDGFGWVEVDPDTPLPVPPPPVGIPAERVNACAARMLKGSEGHLVDPSGSGRGRWLATMRFMWLDDGSGQHTSKDLLR